MVAPILASTPLRGIACRRRVSASGGEADGASIAREVYVSNVSVRGSLEDAHQLDALRAMPSQRPIGEAAGVLFEVITNHETLWTITP
jgi:hypothetical protein